MATTEFEEKPAGNHAATKPPQRDVAILRFAVGLLLDVDVGFGSVLSGRSFLEFGGQTSRDGPAHWRERRALLFNRLHCCLFAAFLVIGSPHGGVSHAQHPRAFFVCWGFASAPLRCSPTVDLWSSSTL